ncbi:MAG: tRNA adenosine(34) deaminase TadA [bacterium]
MASQIDIAWMKLALNEAMIALKENEVPVGCVIVKDGNIIGRGHNRVEALMDPSAHAEILAITAASGTLKNWRLLGAEVYITVEPCLMCTGALILSRPQRVIFGARDEKFGCLGSRYHIIQDNRFNHRFDVTEGVCATEAAALLHQFFQKRRQDQA